MKIFVYAFFGLFILSACASQAITRDRLIANTAFALGLNNNDFTISNREDTSTETRYAVNKTLLLPVALCVMYNCLPDMQICLIRKDISSKIAMDKKNLLTYRSNNKWHLILTFAC